MQTIKDSAEDRAVLKALDEMWTQDFRSIKDVDAWVSRRPGDGVKALRILLADGSVSNGESTALVHSYISMWESDRMHKAAQGAALWAKCAMLISLGALIVSAWPYIK